MEKFFLRFLFLIFGVILFVKAGNFNLVVNEIMYNPEGNDTSREWIEIVNQDAQSVKIIPGKAGWRINDGTNHLFKNELIINPRETFVIVQNKDQFLNEYPNFNGKLVEANFSLKNDSGTIQIFDENKNLVINISYNKNCGGYNNSFSIVFIDNKCYENKIKGGTPGQLNYQLVAINERQTNGNFELAQNSPQALQQKNNQIQEINNDQQEIIEKEEKTEEYKQIESNKDQDIKQTRTIQAENNQEVMLATLIISEFLPNPEGNDVGNEFVELYNYGVEEIDLNGFILEIGKKKVKLNGIIHPYEYFAITNKDYNFSIRNSGEILTLYYQNEKVFSISYEGKAPEDKSFARIEDKWLWTKPSLAEENVLIKEENSLKKLETDLNNTKDFQNMANLILATTVLNSKKGFFSKNILIIASLILITILTVLVFLKL